MATVIKIISWSIIAWGVLILGFITPVLTMLLTGQATPGEPYYVDELAPTNKEAVRSFVIGLLLIIIGFTAKHFAKRHTLDQVIDDAASAPGTVKQRRL